VKLRSGVTSGGYPGPERRGSDTIAATSQGRAVSTYIERGAIKIIEIIGVSDESFDDAVRRGVAKAAESIIGITGVEVQSLNGKVDNGEIVQYRASIKVAFVVR
jgi:flavin-binding protein dodecin